VHPIRLFQSLAGYSAAIIALRRGGGKRAMG